MSCIKHVLEVSTLDVVHPSWLPRQIKSAPLEWPFEASKDPKETFDPRKLIKAGVEGDETSSF